MLNLKSLRLCVLIPDSAPSTSIYESEREISGPSSKTDEAWIGKGATGTVVLANTRGSYIHVIMGQFRKFQVKAFPIPSHTPVLGIEPSTSKTLGKHSTTELHPQHKKITIFKWKTDLLKWEKLRIKWGIHIAHTAAWPRGSSMPDLNQHTVWTLILIPWDLSCI
jgi:hypothetical protein